MDEWLTFEDIRDDILLTYDEYDAMNRITVLKRDILFNKSATLTPSIFNPPCFKAPWLAHISKFNHVELNPNCAVCPENFILKCLKKLREKQIGYLEIARRTNDEKCSISVSPITAFLSRTFISQLRVERQYIYSWNDIATLIHIPSLKNLSIYGTFNDDTELPKSPKSSLLYLECHISGQSAQETLKFYTGLFCLCPRVRQLFVETRHHATMLSALVKSKTMCETLEKLSLVIRTELTKKTVAWITWCLRKLPTTYHVSLHLETSSDTALHFLLQELGKISTITHVNIAVFSAVLCETLQPLVLTNKSNIQHLVLSWRATTHETKGGVESLISQCMLFPKLQSFRLVQQPTSHTLIPREFKSSYDILRELCIDQNLPSDILYKLITSITRNQHLHTLRLHGNFDFEEDCPIVECPIEKIQLVQTQTAPGKHIFNVLHRIAFPRYLWDINLKFNNVDLSESCDIASLSRFGAAERLTLTIMSELSDVGVLHFADQLKTLTELRFFQLTYTYNFLHNAMPFLSTLAFMPHLSTFKTNLGMNELNVCQFMSYQLLPLHSSLTTVQNLSNSAWSMDRRCIRHIMRIQHNKYHNNVSLLELLFDAMQKPFKITARTH